MKILKSFLIGLVVAALPLQAWAQDTPASPSAPASPVASASPAPTETASPAPSAEPTAASSASPDPAASGSPADPTASTTPASPEPDSTTPAEDTMKIMEIDVIGTEYKDAVLLSMFTKPGDDVSAEQVRADLRRVYGLGYFMDVTAT